MKKFVCVILLFCLVGCSATSRMVRLRDCNENTISIQFNGSMREAKEVVRVIGKEMGLIEVTKLETKDFIFLRTNLLKAIGTNLFLGPLAGSMVTGQTRIGFFFENKGEDTTITISEEVSSLVKPSRFIIRDKIKLWQYENK